MATKTTVEAEENVKEQLAVDIVDNKKEESKDDKKEKKNTSQESKEKTYKDYYHDLTNYLDDLFGKKAPKLPKGAVEPLLVIIPILNVIGIVLSVFGLIAIILITLGLSPLLAVGGLGTLGQGLFVTVFNIIASLVSLYLSIKSAPGLFNRTKEGWKYAYWGALWGFVINLVSLNILSLIVGSLISAYFLFQLRPNYKK